MQFTGSLIHYACVSVLLVLELSTTFAAEILVYIQHFFPTIAALNRALDIISFILLSYCRRRASQLFYSWTRWRCSCWMVGLISCLQQSLYYFVALDNVKRIAYTRLVDFGLPSENGFLSLREIYIFRFLCLSLTIIPRTLGIKQTTGLFSQKTFKKQRKPRYQVLLSALGQSKEKSLILLPRLKNM